MTDSSAKVTVLMSCYNNDEYVGEAIESILGQSFSAFEFLIINDGSTDSSLNIIMDYASKDTRIKLINHEKNRGLIASLNEGLQQASCELIARMDADDVALPQRLQYQYDFMQTHPEVIMCGGAVNYKERSKEYIYRLTHDEIIIEHLFGNHFCHPTVMYKKTVIMQAGGYSQQDTYAEDYGLWVKLIIGNYGKLANLPQQLISYRTHPGVERAEYRKTQMETASRIVKLLFKHFNVEIDINTADLLLFGHHRVLSEVLMLEKALDELAKNLSSHEGYHYFLQRKVYAIMRARRRLIVKKPSDLMYKIPAKLWFIRRTFFN